VQAVIAQRIKAKENYHKKNKKQRRTYNFTVLCNFPHVVNNKNSNFLINLSQFKLFDKHFIKHKTNLTTCISLKLSTQSAAGTTWSEYLGN